jgi:nucleoid DNA-binding protein
MAKKEASTKKSKNLKSSKTEKKTGKVKTGKKLRAAAQTSLQQKARSIADKQTRAEILRLIAGETGLSAKEVRSVFLCAADLAKRHIMKRGSGEFSIPEMALKIIRKTRPATKKRMGRNPKTGEAVMIPARSARQIVRVRVLKGLKEVLA